MTGAPAEPPSPDRSSPDPESQLVAAFVDLTAGLAAAGDGTELLARLVDHCVASLSATAAGVILRGPEGQLAVLAASSPDDRLVEVAQLQRREGPCLDCIRGGRPVVVGDLAHLVDRWPGWRPRALAAGVRSVLALPMATRGTTFGGLNLFADRPGAFSDRDVRVGSALAGVATAIVVTNRDIRRGEQLSAQLELALQSRIVIEQAKGVVATALGMDVETAFAVLRTFCRRSNQRLTEVADDLRNGRLSADELVPGRVGDGRADEG